MRAAPVLKLLAINLLVFGLMLAALEGALCLLYVAQIPWQPLRQAARDFYIDHERETLQYLPECARYDQELTYVLRPGSCRFKNREFDTTVHINSRGFHDRESDLSSPEILAIGDSQTFGWGVEDHKNFASLLQELTGRVVLNAATPSYGTVRELLVLKQLAASNADTVILQYSDNDIRENSTFKHAGNNFKASPEKDYNFYGEQLRQVNKNYFPFKFMRHFMPPLVRKVLARKRNPTVWQSKHLARKEAQLFVNVLTSNSLELNRYKIIVLPINGYNFNNSYFAAAVEHHLDILRGKQSAVPNITVLDLSVKLLDQHYFYYDDHLNAAGHRVVAEALAELLRSPVAQQ